MSLTLTKSVNIIGGMADKSTIEWTDATWNPTRGCSRITTGCGGPNHQGGCYAEKIAARFSEPGMAFHGFAERTAHGGRWTGKLALVPEMLDQPIRWKRPRRIFVNSMSDLFHEALPDEAIDKVFAAMSLCPRHTFQILTKRADRMRAYFSGDGWNKRAVGLDGHGIVQYRLPLPNVWLGTSIEDRASKDRLDHLRATPAAVRFLSCEPLLENIGALDLAGIHQVIAGGESGPRSRYFEVEAAQGIQTQCKHQGVAFFMKQLGAKPTLRRQLLKLKDKKGGNMTEWPEDLRVREFPASVAA